MNFIRTLEVEWSKKFPGDPLPSNIRKEEEESYDSLFLQNAMRKCEHRIEELEKKLQKEIFLRDFLKTFTKESLLTIESKNKTANALNTDIIPSKDTSNPTLTNLLADTLSISTMVFREDKIIPKTNILTNLKTGCEQDNNVVCLIPKTSNIKSKLSDISEISEISEKLLFVQVKENNAMFEVNIDENQTDRNVEEDEQRLRNGFESFTEMTSNELKITKTNEQRKSFTTNRILQKGNYSTLRPTVSLKKAIPPSLPPKPKRHYATCADTKKSNNNGKDCCDKTNLSENENLNAAADHSHIELGGQLPPDSFFYSTEVGKCSGFCANDVKVRPVKSGAKAVKSSSVKQVTTGSPQPLLKIQRGGGLTTKTAETNSATTDLQLSEKSFTNNVVKATASSDDNNKQIKDLQDYGRYDTIKEKDHQTHPPPPKSTLFVEKEKSGERKSLIDIKDDQESKKSPTPPVQTRKSVLLSNSECSILSKNKPDCECSSCSCLILQQQTSTITNENKKETEQNPTKNGNGKENVGATQLSLIKKHQLYQENLNNEKDAINKIAVATGGSHQNTDMSSFKKQREDICFVSYRKLDTEFFESSLPERRSSLLKSDTTSEENQGTIFVQKPNVLSLGKASNLKTFGHINEDDSVSDTKKNSYETNSNDQQSGTNAKSTNSGLPIDSSLVTNNTDVLVFKQKHPSLNMKESSNTENIGICQDSEQTISEDCYIEIKKNDIGEYKTRIEFTDEEDEESDSSEKMPGNITLGNQQSLFNSEDDTDEEILSSFQERFGSEEDLNLLKMRKQAVRQFLAKEEIFVETLENIQKLMDQFNATIDSKESLLSKNDFEVIFFKIPEILFLHQTCVKQLAPKVQNWKTNETVGFIFKELMIHFPTFEDYTKNYPLAVETINKCSQINIVFKKIAEEASFNSEIQNSLAVLLYKPISQLQFNTSFIQELLHYTPKNHLDYAIVDSTWRLTQCNLTGITNKNEEEKTENEQYLLKSDYLVELVGNVRKLRCFFLFNDVLVCTKEKFWQKSSFDVKWFIPVYQLLLDTNSDNNDETKYHSKEAVDEIKRKISCLETELRKENEKDKLSDRAREKLKKKLSELQRELARLSGYLEFILKHHKKTYTLLMSTDYAWEEWKEAIYGLKNKSVTNMNFTASEVQQLISNCKKLPNVSNLSIYQQTDKMEEHGFVGSLCVTLHELTGLDESSPTYCCLELDSCGQFFTKARSVVCNDVHPVWNEEFELELDYSHTLRILCYKKGMDNQGDVLLGKSALALSRNWLSNFTRKTISMNKISLVISINHLPPNKTIQRIPSKVKSGTFGIDIQKVAHHQNRHFPAIISICTQEIEKRGLHEVGIYRVSGGQSDIKRLKHAFQKNTMRACKMIVDPEFNIHAVAAILKLFFRELPEPLFTNALHNKFLAINDINEAELKKKTLLVLIHSLPDVNYHTLIHLIHHLQRISENSHVNKMTNSNLAVMFGQSLMQPAPSSDQNSAEMASFLNVNLQNDVLEYIMNLQCNGTQLARP